MRTHLAKNSMRVAMMLIVLLFTSGCGEQPNVPHIPGIKGPHFNVQDGSILISMEFETININQGARLPIPKLDNSYLELTPAQFGGTFFQATLDFEDIENGDFEFVDPQSLPGGRPLPGIVGGQLPAVAINVPDFLDTTFYLSKRVFGFFTPFRVNVDAIITQRLVIAGTHIGNISLVGKDEGGENSGVLLLFNLTKQGKKELKRIIKRSKKTPNRIF